VTFLAAKPRVWTNLSSSRHSYRNLSPHLGCAEDNNPDCQLLRPARFLPCMKFAFVAKSRPAQIPICAMFQVLSSRHRHISVGGAAGPKLNRFYFNPSVIIACQRRTTTQNRHDKFKQNQLLTVFAKLNIATTTYSHSDSA
jgi:hypothetical protein